MRIRRVVVPAFGIAFGNLALLGLLIGWGGASRAYGRPDTLFSEHAASVLAAGLAAFAIAVFVARRLTSIRVLGLLFAFLFVADVAAGLLVVMAIGEITLDQLPRVVIVETALGTQLLAVGAGGFIGYLGRPGFRHRWRPDA